MLQTAITASKKAGEITKYYFGNIYDIKNKDKSEKNFSTIADKEAEDAIKKIILDKFPNHGFWGEESGRQNMEKEYIWIVDPIDGTTNFVHNIPMFGVSIALIKNNNVLLGTAYLPCTDELFYAENGKGAFLNNKQIKVSDTENLKDSICSIEYWSRNNEHTERGLNDIINLSYKIKKIRYLSSTVFELCRVANGDLDFCIMDTKFLDIAAAKLIIEEAGGLVKRYKGGNIKVDMENKLMRIISSNKLLENKIIV